MQRQSKRRLFINGGMRTRITVTLRINAKVRKEPMPAGLASKLQKNSTERPTRTIGGIRVAKAISR